MKTIGNVILALALVSSVYAAEDGVIAVHGTIRKIDSATKAVVMKTSDGTEHSLRFLDRTVVHGADSSADATQDSWHGLKEGTEVIAHYTKRGTEDTALEIDKVGKDGLKATDGTIKDLDRAGKKVLIETGNGTEETFLLTDYAATDAGRGLAKGAEKGAKVTVYYSGEAGKKVAHFFERS